MKIHKIKLYDQALVEEDGEYKLAIENLEEVPCIITNRALQISKQLGVIKTSLMTDLVNLSSGDGEAEVGDLNDLKTLQAIYVGYVGGQLLLGKKQPKYEFDEFLDKYNAGTTERTTLYSDLLLADQENNFAKEIEKSTSRSLEKGEKK